MAKTISKWGPVIIWAGLIFLVSSIPTLPKTEIIWWDFILKKSAHMIEYGIFYFFLIRALGKRGTLLAFIMAILYACSDEYHQSFVPGRTATLRDVGFDIIGIIISYQVIKYQKAWNSLLPALKKPKN